MRSLPLRVFPILRRRARFMGLTGRGEPLIDRHGGVGRHSFGENFYPTVLTASDVSFVTEQGILPPSGTIPAKEILFPADRQEGAFEWQQGVLTSWDGKAMKLLINGQPTRIQAEPGCAHLPACRRRDAWRCAKAHGSAAN